MMRNSVRTCTRTLKVVLVGLAITTLMGPARAGSDWPSLETPPPKTGGGESDVALIISIESYAVLPPIEGAESNGIAWVRWFEATRGAGPGRVVHLKNRDATPANILAKARELSKRAEPSGMVWVVFIGHGAPSADQSDGLLVGWGAQETALGLYDQSVPQSELIDALGGGRVAPLTMIVDAGFNGMSRDGTAIARGLPPKLLVDLMKPLPPQVTLISACQADEFAGQLPGEARPAFSYLLLGALRGWADDHKNANGQVTVAEAVDYARAALRAVLNGRSQSPVSRGGNPVLTRKVTEGAPDLSSLREPANKGEAIGPPTGGGLSAGSPAESAKAPKGYVEIPAGTFTMGSPDSEPDRNSNEVLHQVRISRPFWLKATEVTQAEWQSVMGSSPSGSSSCGATCPVDNVSWKDAIRYLNKLSEREGLEPCYRVDGSFVGIRCTGYRLPTEAEWEYAARAGTTSARYGSLDSVAWYDGNSGGSLHPVAQKQANAWGLHDMLGNLFEWVQDWWGSYGGAATDPAGPASGDSHVFRGGCWYFDGAKFARAAYRGSEFLSYRLVYFGVRPARSVP